MIDLTEEDDEKKQPPPARVPSPHDEDEDDPAKSVKWLLWWVLQLCTPAQCRLILRGLMRADGKWASQEQQIHTASVRFRDELVQLALHAGYAARIACGYEKGATRGYHKRGEYGKIYRQPEAGSEHLFTPIVAKHDLWRVHYSDARQGGGNSVWPTVNINGDGIKEEPYDGVTWCVRVDHPHHLIVAQRALRDDTGRVYKASKPLIIGQCIVFELLSINLYDLIRNTKLTGVTLILTAKFAYQLLTTLAHLSSPARGNQRVIHCDLKVNNIIHASDRRSGCC